MATIFRIPLPDQGARWAIEQASLAPSLHNTQPWRFTWDGSCFELYGDTRRGLTASDPDGRELVISCGAALFNLRLALRKIGYDASVRVLPDRADPRLLAVVDVTESDPADVTERRAFAAMMRRHTHRGFFDEMPLTPAVAVFLQQAAERESAELVFVTDPGQRRRVLALARAAERAMAMNDDVQAEIDAWTPPPGSERRDGVPATAYAAEPAAHPDDLAPRDFDQGRGYGQAEPSQSSPGSIAVLVTGSDLEKDWLASGQALEAVLVRAAEHGAFAALHSQLTEVAHLRQELRRELCISGYPQILMRLGYAAEISHTPRRRVDDVLERRPLRHSLEEGS